MGSVVPNLAQLYSFASSLGDFQFLYIDLFVIIPIAVASEWCHITTGGSG